METSVEKKDIPGIVYYIPYIQTAALDKVSDRVRQLKDYKYKMRCFISSRNDLYKRSYTQACVITEEMGDDD